VGIGEGDVGVDPGDGGVGSHHVGAHPAQLVGVEVFLLLVHLGETGVLLVGDKVVELVADVGVLEPLGQAHTLGQIVVLGQLRVDLLEWVRLQIFHLLLHLLLALVDAVLLSLLRLRETHLLELSHVESQVARTLQVTQCIQHGPLVALACICYNVAGYHVVRN